MPILTKWAIIGKLCQERTVIYVDEVYICELCQQAFEPEEVNGVRVLKKYKGYTVDMRLKEFRRVKLDYSEAYKRATTEIEYISFDSPKGKKLLAQMHEEVTR